MESWKSSKINHVQFEVNLLITQNSHESCELIAHVKFNHDRWKVVLWKWSSIRISLSSSFFSHTRSLIFVVGIWYLISFDWRIYGNFRVFLSKKMVFVMASRIYCCVCVIEDKKLGWTIIWRFTREKSAVFVFLGLCLFFSVFIFALL